jgi:hypothetical protein
MSSVLLPLQENPFNNSLQRTYSGNILTLRDSGHKQIISNGGNFKPALAEKDKKQTMVDL